MHTHTQPLPLLMRGHHIPSQLHLTEAKEKTWEGIAASEHLIRAKASKFWIVPLCGQPDQSQPISSPPSPLLYVLACWLTHLLVLVGEGEPLNGILYSSSSHISQSVLKLQQLLQREKCGHVHSCAKAHVHM